MTAYGNLAPDLRRSEGMAVVALVQNAGKARIVRLRQSGSAKAILPKVGNVPEVVFLNTSGGLTGGDTLSFALSLGPNVTAVATTQTAERVYRTGGGFAKVSVDLAVGKRGWLDWQPQETILFNASAIDRRTSIDLTEDAGCLALEVVVLGRLAIGEVVRQVMLRDTRLIRRDSVPVMLEPLMLNDAALQAGSAVLSGAKAFASLVMGGGHGGCFESHPRGAG